jgi:hypothetical protein
MPLFTPQVLVGTFLASLREIKRKANRKAAGFRLGRSVFGVGLNLARLTLTRAQADMNDSDTQDTTSQNALDIALTPGVVMDTNITLTGELFRTTPSSLFSPADPSPCSVYRVVLCEHQAILERYSQRDDHECIHRSRVPDTLQLGKTSL